MQSIIDFLLHCEKKGLISFTASIERIRGEILAEWRGVGGSTTTIDIETTNESEADLKNHVDDIPTPGGTEQSGLRPNLPTCDQRALLPCTDEQGTGTRDTSESEDYECVIIRLPTPEAEVVEDHSPLERPGHAPFELADHSHHPAALSAEQTSRPDRPTADTDLSPLYGPTLHTVVQSEPSSLSSAPPRGDVGTRMVGRPVTVAKLLKFTPDSSPTPLAPKPPDNGSPLPTTVPPAWKDARQSTRTGYSSEDESSDGDGDFEHILRLATPEAQQVSPAPCGSGTQPEAAAQVPTLSCVTAAGGRGWRARDTEALLSFSPDFSKGLSAFMLHHSDSKQNASQPALKNKDTQVDEKSLLKAVLGRSDSGRLAPPLSSAADKENIWQDPEVVQPRPQRPPLPTMPGGGLKTTGSARCAPLEVSSDDDETDKKMESLFSDLRIQSAKKNSGTRIVSRKSLQAFIVSDSDEGEDEESAEDQGLVAPPTERMPSNTPDSRVPTRHPFTERPQLTTPVCSSALKSTHLTPSAHKSVARNRNQMARELYQLFNQTVFNNQLPENLEIKWNRKMRTTAGYCYNSGFGLNRISRIELSQKVCNSYDRIRDTLIHEMCHAATWLISGVKKGGHGNEWRGWAAMANKAFPFIQRIARCHNYDIDYKYVYSCTRCDFRHGRHSKSVDIEHKRCPHCLSTLQLEPKLNVDGTPATTRKLTRYVQFIQDNYSEAKKAFPLKSHKEIMEVLRERYYAQQAEGSQES